MLINTFIELISNFRKCCHSPNSLSVDLTFFRVYTKCATRVLTSSMAYMYMYDQKLRQKYITCTYMYMKCATRVL